MTFVIEFTPAPPPGERADLQAVGYLRTEYFAGLIIHHPVVYPKLLCTSRHLDNLWRPYPDCQSVCL